MGNPTPGPHPVGNTSDPKSCFALTASGRNDAAEEDQVVVDAPDAGPTRDAAGDQGEASSSAHQAPAQHDSTAASEQPVVHRAQDSKPSDAEPNSGSVQDQQAQASLNADLAGLKLDDADSEQLQLALAMSLGQQEAETAQDSAQAAMRDQGSAVASLPASFPESAEESVLPAPDMHNHRTDGPVVASPGSVNEATEVGRSSTQAWTLPATPSAAASDQGAEPNTSPSRDANQQEGASADEHAVQPDGYVTAQQSSEGASLATLAGTLAPLLPLKHAVGCAEKRCCMLLPSPLVMRLTLLSKVCVC